MPLRRNLRGQRSWPNTVIRSSVAWADQRRREVWSSQGKHAARKVGIMECFEAACVWTAGRDHLPPSKRSELFKLSVCYSCLKRHRLCLMNRSSPSVSLLVLELFSTSTVQPGAAALAVTNADALG
jgi:hypothetical protein